MIAIITEQLSVRLLFLSNTKFSFEGASGIVNEFVIENDSVKKIIINNDGFSEWKKIK